MPDVELVSSEISQVNRQPKPISLIRRAGCWLGLAVWLLLLLFPCVAIALISQGEISVQLGDLPGQSLRVWLLQDATERGIGVASPSIVSRSDQNACMQTSTSFLLWMGNGEPSSYCECYAYNHSRWELTSTTQGYCNP